LQLYPNLPVRSWPMKPTKWLIEHARCIHQLPNSWRSYNIQNWQYIDTHLNTKNDCVICYKVLTLKCVSLFYGWMKPEYQRMAND
jgi:hypothetical protein